MTYVFNGVKYDCSDKYSGRDFTGLNLQKDLNINKMNICSSCFSQDKPNTPVFPESSTQLIFIDCNMTNVLVTKDMTVLGGQKLSVEVQNDLEDWIVDAQGNPVEPVDKERFLKLGISIDPADIPSKLLGESPLAVRQQEIAADKARRIKEIEDE